MSSKLEQFLSKLEEMEKSASHVKSYVPHPTGMLPESMRSMNILSSHNRTPYIGVGDAEFIFASREAIPRLLRLVRLFGEALKSIGGAALMNGNGKEFYDGDAYGLILNRVREALQSAESLSEGE